MRCSTVGSPDTIDLSLHLLRPGAMLVLVGAGRQADRGLEPGVEPGTHCARHHQLRSEPALGGRRTMEQVAEWLADPAYLVDGLVTHQYDLDEWTLGMDTASADPKHRR